MSWYAIEERAEKAAERKSKWSEEEYVVVQDDEMPRCWWAQSKRSLEEE